VQSAEHVLKNAQGTANDREVITRWLVGLGGLEDLAERGGVELSTKNNLPPNNTGDLVSSSPRQSALIRLKQHLEKIENPKPYEAAMLNSINLSLAN
jgi:hypothetical protein